MHNELTADSIFLYGDSHDLHIWSAIAHAGLENGIIIHVGDFGVGFRHEDKEFKTLKMLDDLLGKKKLQLLVIRGNHDDPKIFDTYHKFNMELRNVHLLPDYTHLTINGKKFLFVGGATSIDRQFRKIGQDYWIDEPFVLAPDYAELDKCDVLITHTSPIECFPLGGLEHLAGFFQGDPLLRHELVKEREDVSTLFNHVEPEVLVYGHFHTSNLEIIRGCKVKCLDINEIWELKI